MLNYKELCLNVCNLARKTGDYIALQSEIFNRTDVEQKGSHDYVSYVDKTAEQQIIAGLKDFLPEAGFIAEESSSHKNEDPINWIIDPLDGTTNFIHGVPVYSISIALMENGGIVMGVVYEISRKECFYAWKGGDAMLNGKSIRVSENRDFDSALLATGFPYYDYGMLDSYLLVFRHFVKHTAGLRRLGSAAADLAYVACGRFEGFYEYGLQAWDVAAGSFIVQMAGGSVTDFHGESDYIFGGELIAGNATAQPEMLRIIQEYFRHQ